MSELSFAGRLREFIAEYGVFRTIQFLGNRVYRRILPYKVPTHPFDRRHGVDTSQLIDPKELKSGHEHDSHSNAYWGVAPSVFRPLIDRWQTTFTDYGYSLEDYVFVDLGCGKGRAVMLASENPFRRALGVELNAGLAIIGQQNLEKWNQSSHACNDLAILHGDATVFPFPDAPVLLYLYNPFGAYVMQLLLDRLQTLAATRQHPIDILYLYPLHRDLVGRTPGMQMLWEGDITYSWEDTAVDAFEARKLECCVYRLPANTNLS